jgi:antitoxin CptB
VNRAASEAQLKRLRWRCRRGTRELDALLGGWLDAQGAQAKDGALTSFDELLDQPDPQIWDWLMGYTRPPRADWQEIVDAIRTRNRV